MSPPSSKGRRVGFSDDNADLIATDGFLNVSDAVKLLRDASASTRASSQVEQTIWQRIAKQVLGSYPVVMLTFCLKVP